MEHVAPNFNDQGGATIGSEAVTATKRQPHLDQDRGSRLAGVRNFIWTLQSAVDAAREASPRFDSSVSALHERLTDILADDVYMRLVVGQTAFVFEAQAVLIDDLEEDVSSALHGDGIRELFFKEGVTRDELKHFVNALSLRGTQEDRSDEAVDTLDALLWAFDLRHIGFRVADELQAPEPSSDDDFDWVQASGVHATELPSDSRPAALFSATSPDEDFPPLDAERLSESAARLLRDPSAAPPRDKLWSTGAILQQLAAQLITVHSGEFDPRMCKAAVDMLVQLVQSELREERITAVGGLLQELRSQADDGGADTRSLDAVTTALQKRIWDERTIMTLGSALEGPAAGADEARARAVREILLLLGNRIIDPLCTLIVELRSTRARKLACVVLSVVGAEEPATIARRAEAQPWYVARSMAYVLGLIGGPRVLPYLRKWSRHEDSRVRLEVARALARLDHGGAAVVLSEMLSDSEYRVRQSAIWCLSRRSDGAALSRLRQFLFEDEEFRTRPVGERDEFFRIYGKLVNEECFNELLKLVGQRQVIQRGWKVELRRGAAVALGETERPEAREALRKQCKSMNARLRKACEDALEAIRNRAVFEDGDAAAPATEDDLLGHDDDWEVEDDG